MRKLIFTLSLLCFFIIRANAQFGVMKLVGSDTKNYNLGFGAFIKTGVPVSNSGAVTIEIGVNYFPSKDEGEGTVMCPLKVGYRYTLNRTRAGFYVEPQVGYNIYGVTSLLDDNGRNVDLKYNGVIFAAGGGYMFPGKISFDLNLRYETVIAHGGSNNLVSLGITRSFMFGKKD